MPSYSLFFVDFMPHFSYNLHISLFFRHSQACLFDISRLFEDLINGSSGPRTESPALVSSAFKFGGHQQWRPLKFLKLDMTKICSFCP